MLNSLNRGIRKFLHHPLFTDARKGKHAGDRLDKYPANRDRLESLFVRYNVKTVVAGHEHFYQGKTVENIRHIITLWWRRSALCQGSKNGFIIILT